MGWLFSYLDETDLAVQDVQLELQPPAAADVGVLGRRLGPGRHHHSRSRLRRAGYRLLHIQQLKRIAEHSKGLEIKEPK